MELQIDELLLDGFERVDSAAVEVAMRGELQRLLSAAPGRAIADGGRQERIDAGAITLHPAASAGEIGVQVARAVHRGLSGGGAS